MIKILALVEASTVTSPVRLLLDFGVQARSPNDVRAELTLATFVRGQSHPAELVAAAQSAGIPLRLIPERFRFDRSVIAHLQRLADELAPDIIQTEHVKSHFLLRMSGLNRKYAWVAFHHGYTTTDMKVRAYNQLDRWSLAAAMRVITVSDSYAHELARQGVPPSRLRVVHSAIHPIGKRSDAEIERLRQSLGLLPDGRVLLAVGRLSDEKGHLDLIAAFKQVRDSLPSAAVRLIIAGEGPERSRIEAKAVSLGIREHVTLLGHVADASPYYDIADVMVLPSHREGSPIVLLEAMAAGLPIVATAVGGVPEIVNDGEDTILVEGRNPAALADGIVRVLSDGNLARSLGQNAMHAITERFSPAKRARTLMDFYKEIVLPFHVSEAS
ncbi:MAG: glycosyltransferase family 4 protein [Acidobacteria bacterium]|nr:glycosyltransferase family 4 protein [Acidobacteriota bacterium]